MGPELKTVSAASLPKQIIINTNVKRGPCLEELTLCYVPHSGSLMSPLRSYGAGTTTEHSHFADKNTEAPRGQSSPLATQVESGRSRNGRETELTPVLHVHRGADGVSPGSPTRRCLYSLHQKLACGLVVI